MFWQPGRTGWEGEQRQRLQQRRAAQLAAAAETAAEGDACAPLSSGPEDPALERWLRRQLGAEGERLDQLRQRLWQDARWKRHGRTLILEAHSLLWALDPLEATPEGVVLQVSEAGDLERLGAQLEMLDSLRRPQLLLAPFGEPEALERQLEPGLRFETIAARHPWRGASPELIDAWLGALERLASPGAELRLLFSQPRLGPAGALLELPGSGNHTPCRTCWSRWWRLKVPGCRPVPIQRPWGPSWCGGVGPWSRGSGMSR